MANDGSNQLRQSLINPRPSPLFPLPENNDVDVTIPMPMTPSELRDRLIFGSQRDTSLLIDALSRNPSPSSSATTSFFDTSTKDLPFPPHRPRFHRSKTAPPMSALNNLTHPNDPKTEHSVSKSIVRQVVPFFLLYLSLGVFIYWLNQDSYLGSKTHPVVDALYFCVVTMCTIGYGDITPDSVVTKLFSILFVLVGFGFIGWLFSGIATYVQDIQEDYKFEYLRDFRNARMRIRFKVGTALGIVVSCLGFGVLVMHFIEEIGWLDSLYFSFMSVTTVGYKDQAFKTLPGRLLAAIWLLVSTLAIARAFLYLAAARVDKRDREMEKRVLNENMSISQFFAADIDNNGFLSKSDFVLYKLKMMGKITNSDIHLIADLFDKLDQTGSGKITLLDNV